MKTIYGLLLSMLLLSTYAHAGNRVVLSESNHVTLTGVIDSDNVNKAIYELSVHPADSLYLFIDSPGGSVYWGVHMIEFLNNTHKRVYCVAGYAASMAFSIVQHCHKRYVSSNSTMMQHVSSLSLEGEMPKVVSRLKLVRQRVRSIEISDAKRIGISLRTYKRKTIRDWWIYGANAIEEGVADKLVRVTCTVALIKQTKEGPKSAFGLASTVSACPLIEMPIE